MSSIGLISENDNSTVLAEYTGLNRVATSFQSEDALEKELIKTLVEQGYERLNINSEDELILNLRRQLEKLNNYHFTDGEWDSFFTKVIANKNDYIIEKTRLIQEDYKQEITLDSGEKKNIYLIDKNNIHNNSLQVLNQYVNNDGNFDNLLTHPSFHLPKTYRVTINAVLTKSDINSIKEGIILDDGIKTLPSEIKVVNYDLEERKCTFELTIYEGKNRQIRRMMEALGYEVKKLHRLSFGPVRDDDLPIGAYRRLRPHEIKSLKEMASKGQLNK